MCGIVGYTGTKLAKDVLIEGLRRLEYRGYDSAGIALQEGGSLSVTRRVGKVEGLAEAVADLPTSSTCGIGHTRWATHGAPSERNAHPHVSCDGSIAVVHNGIIENFQELRDALAAKGHTFRSDTDTEVVAHLVEDYYEGDLLAAVSRATRDIIGAYGLAITCAAEPGRIVATRKDSPIVLAHGEAGSYVASDIIAVIEASRDVAVLGDGQLADMRPDGITYYNADLKEIEPSIMHVDWDVDVAEKGGYPDFMLKEIHEQPRVIRDTLAGRMTNGVLSIDELGMSLEELRLIDRVYIVACGTSYHAGLIARQLIEGWARIPTEVEVASEFRYRNPIITPSTLVVAVSQSGETADTLAAIREARIKGGKVFGITNVIGSPVARESDGVIYTKANKEIAVASTKSFLGQVVSLTLLSMVLAQAKGKLTNDQVRLLFKDLADTAEKVELVLSDTEAIDEAARACKDATDAFFIGRGMGSATSFEGALKLKEISYVHAEAYPAGEMKHGPIALLEPGFPVIAVATQSPVYDKVVSNLQESRSRGAMIVAVATEGDEEIKANADYVIYIPKVRDAFMPIVASVPLQLFARSMAIARGCDVDKPRNLAKSVTVE
ncbi:glutamine--fructose-6-phosphate transaminase (isomerizing) [Hugonella massiliensis]|uniref:glutamine--fructose-6-phosphate transaminase (isomerizing) n=1 Tax=Hugonella massiliensis TaxID=1720315 RepID=UPI00073E19DE|nr:glutamine--fructose-6-phosphate transaminase (isomerizing) [Hugonella massiliensis]